MRPMPKVTEAGSSKNFLQRKRANRVSRGKNSGANLDENLRQAVA